MLSFLLLPLPTFQWFSDYWEHASALRVLSEHPLSPSNPHYATSDPDRQFVPLFVMLGWLVYVTGISLHTAISLGAFLTVVLLCVGVKRFALEYFRYSWAPTVTLAVLLFSWGTPWVWTGFYEFRALFYNSFYPASLVFSLTFVTWAVTIKGMRADNVTAHALLSLTALYAIMFVSHQLGGLFAIGGAILFITFEPLGSLKTRLLLILPIVVGVGITWWWPYFNPVALTFHGAGDKANEGSAEFYKVLPVLLMVGPALIGVPILGHMARVKQHVALPLGFFALFLAYAFGGYLQHPVAHRFLSYTVVYLHLAIAWGILAFWKKTAELAVQPARNRKVVLVVFIVASLIATAQVGLASGDFLRIGVERIFGRSFGSFPSQQVVAEYVSVARKLPVDAIIFATDDPALGITAFKGKVISRPRPQLMIADGADRTLDNKVFFSPAASLAQRWALVEKYGATHVLVKADNVLPEVVVALRQMGHVVTTGRQLVLIELDSARGAG